MNIAFSALLAFILVIPGLVFLRVRRSRGEFARFIPPSPEPFSVEIASAIAWSIIIHGLLCAVASGLSVLVGTPRPNLIGVLMLLVGRFGDKDAELAPTLVGVAENPVSAIVYFFSGIALAIAGGMSSGRWIDRISSRCGLLSSRDVAVQDWQDFFKIRAGEDVLVTTIVEVGNTNVLYLGMLTGLQFNAQKCELEYLTLRDVWKRQLDSNDERFESVYGHQFLLRYSEIKTLNVIYVSYANSRPA